MGGSTDREGRVEVCVGSSLTVWRTVCTGSQELTGAVCSQMGYVFEGIMGDQTMLLIPPISIYRKLGGSIQHVSFWIIPKAQTKLYTTKQWIMALQSS